MEALVAEVYDQILESRHTGDVHPRKSGNMSALLHRFAPILKDPAFADEQEWRIISRPLMNSFEQFGFRPRGTPKTGHTWTPENRPTR
jgi:hypothetical protein